MNLRCWPGCLAFVRSPALAGHIVTVVQSLGYWRKGESHVFNGWLFMSISDGFVWEVRPPSGVPHVCFDVNLTPITPPPDNDVVAREREVSA